VLWLGISIWKVGSMNDGSFRGTVGNTDYHVVFSEALRDGF
jgi:hypothetical protein